MPGPFHNIALVGMMGSGKSSVGPRLAELLGFTFVDVDSLITQAAGKPIPVIFENDGEEAFRDLETAHTLAAARAEGLVIATGGGAVVREVNRAVLLDRCWTVWLSTSPEEHLRRVTTSERRPVLERSADPLAAVRSILSERERFYAQAHHREDTTGLGIEEIAHRLAAAWAALQP
ncbi:MAG TPA: shikimate kinase [Armatimonadota bacterium]|jgi:shikimate kinase